MVVVAVADGNSWGERSDGTFPSLRRSIVTALHSHPSHTPVVLSRETYCTRQWLLDLGVEVRRVNYLSQDTLIAGLKGVHTVVSLLGPHDRAAQIALLQAAVAAGCVRFAPSEFGVGSKASERIPTMAPKVKMWSACEAAVEEQRSKGERFEWCRFMCAIFMNYLGYGCEGEEEALAGKGDDGEFIWYQRSGALRAKITTLSVVEVERGERKAPMVVMTEIGDIGKFVAAACSLEEGKWEVDMGMAGSVMRMDEVVKVIEKVRKRKMAISYVAMKELEVKPKTLEQRDDSDEMERIDMAMMYARDQEGEGFFKPRLYELCPEVNPVTVEEYMQQFWA